MFLLLAIAIPLGVVGPTKPDTKGHDSAVTAALSNAASNNLSAQGAPQQAVVNGWLARDLMEIQIRQNNDELVLLHLTVAVLIAALLSVIIAGGTAVRGKRDAEPDRGDSPLGTSAVGSVGGRTDPPEGDGAPCNPAIVA